MRKLSSLVEPIVLLIIWLERAKDSAHKKAKHSSGSIALTPWVTAKLCFNKRANPKGSILNCLFGAIHDCGNQEGVA